jgi:hypothetical protein
MTIGQLENGMKTVQQDAARLKELEQALGEVYDLLEVYAPSWYSEALRGELRSALTRKDARTT